MKRTIALLLALLTLSGCALAEPETYDLETMTLDELLALESEVQTAIMKARAALGDTSCAATREDPVPIGASVRYDGSAYANPAVTDLTVTGVIRGDAAWQKVYSWNSYNPRPADGQEYILVSVKASSVASENDAQAEIYDYDFTFVSAAGVEYEYTYAAGADMELTGLYTGGECEGWVIGLIDKGDEPLLVYLKDSEKPIWFDLNRYASVELDETAVLNTLRRGDISEDVRAMQEALIRMGYLTGSADGNFGAKTESAVMSYQADMGLTPTGIADTETLRLILTHTMPE